MLARLIHRLLTLVPARVVEMLRRHRRPAAVVDRVVSLLSRPAHGQSLPVAAGPAAGLLLRLPASSSVWISGKVEAVVQRTLAEVVQPGDVFFDVGASLGFFTVLGARLVGPAGHVVAFEPHPESVAALRANVELNRLANVVVVPKAVSDSSGERILDAQAAPTATVVKEPSRQSIRVAATSIDDFVSAQPRLAPGVVKIDVEGHELAAVHGMTRTLALHRPVIVCELHGSNSAIAALLSRHGYALEVLEGHARVEDAPPWVHVLARPRERGDGPG